ncbi:F-box protein At3g12350-like [Selaginella moellendorffii]|uniref:F-box protein At3g12350-like n=1 Tax=Selaginella moellendorffii TaxID=88036 RepID=UPI000D1C3D74|nr:F-box protein At3g12350-like [Selaginella moellendorffii]|eukprot:XP_024519920.1 F-box protein At3g12350-like [Selaginella moellendorffii]
MQGFLDQADDGVLCAIFSFLSPRDIASCAAVCRRLQRLCRDDTDLWLALCHRRWAGFTSLRDWSRSVLGDDGELGFMRYRGLYKLLAKWGSLIGFWRGVNGNRSQILGFEWRRNSIHGFRIVPASRGSYQVRRIPFLWLGAAANGKEICVMNPALDRDYGCCRCHASKDYPGSSRDDHGSSSSERIGDLFAGMDSEWDVEDLSRLGLVLVDVHFAGKNHIVLEELNCQRQVTRMKISLAEAVASASFGFSENLEITTRSYGKSPPGSFPFEMYRFLTSKVTSPGSDRAARKQWKRDKERAESRGRLWWLEQLHFVKVVESSPTKSRPFQGLWKGLCRCEALDFLLVAYDDDRGAITSRQVGESSSIRSSWMNLSARNFQQIDLETMAFRLRLPDTNLSTDFRPLASSGNLLDVVS